MDNWVLKLTEEELVEIRIALSARIDRLNDGEGRRQVFEEIRKNSLDRCIGIYKDINEGLTNG